jgi:hypothetical protein
MSNAKKCDRCGMFYQEVEPSAFDVLANSFSEMFSSENLRNIQSEVEEMIDFCPQCSKEFTMWLKRKGKFNGESIYSTTQKDDEKPKV